MNSSFDDNRVIPLRPSQDGMSQTAFEGLQRLVNNEAEQALLGAILVNNRAYDAVCDVLAFDDFAHPLHGQIYAAIGSVISGGGTASPVTLHQYFAGDEAIARFGGGGYLAQLAASAVTIVNSPHYARLIRDLARRRRLVEAADAISRDAMACDDPEREIDAVLDDAEQSLWEISQNEGRAGTAQPLAIIADATLDQTEAAYKRSAGGQSGALVVNTGLADLDKIIAGLEGGDLVVLAGRPSMGKSACAGSVTINAATDGKRALVFSLEMTASQLAMRWFAARTEITTERQRHGKIDQLVDWPRLIEARDHLAKLPIHVDDQARLSVGQIRQRARRVRRRSGLDLIVVDHLQLIRQGGRHESRRTEIGDATGALKALAKELDVPILLLSQLSRALENREDKRPTLADLKESGDIEQDADIVIFLHRDHYYLERAEPKRRPRQTDESFTGDIADWKDRCGKAEGVASLIVAKNRMGRTGVATVAFEAERQRFSNLARSWERY